VPLALYHLTAVGSEWGVAEGVGGSTRVSDPPEFKDDVRVAEEIFFMVRASALRV